jgi:hypothetical protein
MMRKVHCGALFTLAAVLVSLPAQAGLIDNTTVLITGGSAAFPGYPSLDAIDVNANQYVTDFASNGAGNATYIDFTFAQVFTFTQIIQTDRTTSGGANGSFSGGTTDFTTAYEYIFSNDSTFLTNLGIVTVNRSTPSSPTTIASFQTTTSIPNISAQYIRYQVLAANGPNAGVADLEFTAADETSVPEPATLALCSLGAALGLLLHKRR